MIDYQEKFEELEALLASGNEEVVAEYKALIAERIKHNDPQGYIALGYAHYLGYVGFDRDYHTAEKAFLEVLKIIEEPYVANSLGYIYYYGRTSNGVPNYERAFYYFTLAAQAGVSEAVYKLADMYYHGHGVLLNVRHAMYVYQKLYYMSLASFIEDEPSKFADLCLRQASVSIDEHHDELKALGYYLEAEYSLRKRVDEHYVGDERLYAKVKEKISELNASLNIVPPEGKLRRARLDFARDVKGFKEISYALECTLKPLGLAKATLTITDAYRRPFLVTIPELNYAKLHDELHLTFSAKISSEQHFSFATLEITDKKIIIGDLITPQETIHYSLLELSL